jgi:hypothetical protein
MDRPSHGPAFSWKANAHIEHARLKRIADAKIAIGKRALAFHLHCCPSGESRKSWRDPSVSIDRSNRDEMGGRNMVAINKHFVGARRLEIGGPIRQADTSC